MNPRFRRLICFLTLAMFAAFSSDATALARHKEARDSKKAQEDTGARHLRNAGLKRHGHVVDVAAPPRKSALAVNAPAELPLSGDLAAVKNAIDLARRAKTSEATVIEKTISDPAAQKLVE